jgi:transposase
MYVGLDVHKRVCYGTLIDEEGHIVKRGKVASDKQSLGAFLSGIEGATIAMEAGYCWQPIYDALTEAGHTVKLAHPQRVKAIAEARIKTDKVDSETLAHLLRAGLLPESYVPPKDIRELRDTVRRRAFLVRERAKLMNRIHAELAKRGIEPGTPIFTRKGREFLLSLGIDAVSQLLPVMEMLDRQIKVISGSLARMSGEDERTRLLTTIPGVGYYIAALIVAEVGDVRRFGSSERLCSYAGLVPSVRSSGGTVRHGGITKMGSSWMRWALVQAVHVHVQHDTELSRFYRRLSVRKTRQEAVVATARKMLKVMYWMLLEGEPYHPEGREASGGDSGA